jgi:F420-non-reducing hydrogenase iron-sulfur subunit
MVEFNPLMALITCSGDAGDVLAQAGRQKKQYSAGARPLRLCCLGQLNQGLLLRALSLGADGVLAIGCAAEKCRFGEGRRAAEKALAEAHATMAALGWPSARLKLEKISPGETDRLAAVINDFEKHLRMLGPNPLRNLREEELPNTMVAEETGKERPDRPLVLEDVSTEESIPPAEVPAEEAIMPFPEEPVEEEDDLEPIFDVMTGKWISREK